MLVLLLSLLVLLHPANAECNDVLGIADGNDFLATALDLTSRVTNIGTLAGGNAIGVTAMGVTTITGYVSGHFGDASAACEKEKMENWLKDNFVGQDAFETWQDELSVHIDNLLDRTQADNFRTHASSLATFAHVYPSNEHTSENSIDDHLDAIKDTLQAAKTWADNLFGRTKDFADDDDKEHKWQQINNIVALGGIIVKGNTLAMEMHSLLMDCVNADLDFDNSKAMVYAQEIFNWEKFITQAQMEFDAHTENIGDWKRDPSKYTYNQDYEMDTSDQTIYSGWGYGINWCAQHFLALSCRYTLSLGDGDATCWYTDTTDQTPDATHGGQLWGVGTPRRYRRRRCNVGNRNWPGQGGCDRDDGDCSDEHCRDEMGDHYVRSSWVDDNLCGLTGEGYPRWDVAEWQAWRTEEFLWKTMMVSFARVTNGGSAAYATQTGETACEGNSLNENQCLAIGCCNWDDGECWSNVGNAQCHGTDFGDEYIWPFDSDMWDAYGEISKFTWIWDDLWLAACELCDEYEGEDQGIEECDTCSQTFRSVRQLNDGSYYSNERSRTGEAAGDICDESYSDNFYYCERRRRRGLLEEPIAHEDHHRPRPSSGKSGKQESQTKRSAEVVKDLAEKISELKEELNRQEHEAELQSELASLSPEENGGVEEDVGTALFTQDAPVQTGHDVTSFVAGVGLCAVVMGVFTWMRSSGSKRFPLLEDEL